MMSFFGKTNQSQNPYPEAQSSLLGNPCIQPQQDDNTLWIRVIGTSTQKSGLGLVSLGEHSQMMKVYDHANLEKYCLQSIFLNLVIGISCFIV